MLWLYRQTLINEYDKNEPEIIFSGMAGLPVNKNAIFDDSEIEQLMIYIYCTRCLTDIKRFINDAVWFVYKEYEEIIWDNKKGYPVN